MPKYPLMSIIWAQVYFDDLFVQSLQCFNTSAHFCSKKKIKIYIYKHYFLSFIYKKNNRIHANYTDKHLIPCSE